MLVVDCQKKSLQLLLTEGSQTCTGYRESTEDASCRLSEKIPLMDAELQWEFFNIQVM